MRMKPAERRKALQDNKNLKKCITRLETQCQSGSVQFKHQLHTGELVLDRKFYDAFDEAYKEREQEQKQLDDADKERQDAVTEQEYQKYCRQRPPNKKQDDDQEDDKPRKKQKKQEVTRSYKRNTAAKW